ncbi:helix-turn-helix transcriptional regulator [Singulisphaera acidiphila]|uniref:Putative transcriptional regulator n=1 Tax=Singulisphaera acidiphila (strain ATCC BAA-1392 / DSM 18658 / VKM B-2454 / MOB10) TaxID=886293 RepID=L0D7K4_SINAD|nr:WYL domain-containing protein [Singulisphaera acidiphila]AGA24813.1 putative transcriptional regulator [Singulisphaera acidiphila DSM 18658]
MMRDEPALRRQWILLRALSAQRFGLTIQEMVTESGVAAKTIRRDLELFRSLGFPLEETVGEFGRKTWKIVSSESQPPLALALNLDEVIALHLGRRLLDPLAGTPIGDAAGQAFRKIRTMFPKMALEYLERFTNFYHIATLAPADYSAQGERLDTLRTAIEDQRAVHILYQSAQATEPAFRDVYPLTLFDQKGALYLIALDPQEDKLKHYKVVRIEDVELTNIPFPRPQNFDPATYMASSFGIYQGDDDILIKVRFAPKVARYVLETKKHQSERLVKQRDGSVVAEYRLSCTNEIRSWILSFGAKAIVLEPESLRREIAEELQTLIVAYATSVSESRQHPFRGEDRHEVPGQFH